MTEFWINVALAAVIALASVLIGWFIAHLYYRRSSKETPEWAKDIIENLPADPPTLSQLIRLFQKHLDSGDIKIHPVFQIVACPKCGVPASTLEEKVFGDDTHTIVVATCPSCGWSETADVS